MDTLTPFASYDPAAWPRARFLLIDAAQVEPAWWEDFHPLRVVPESHADQAPLFPALLDSHTLDDAQHTRLLERARLWERKEHTPYAIALIDASGATSTLVTHLTRRMSLRRPEGSEDVLRFYDPCVFRHLRGWLLTAEQMDSLLGPIGTWHWREPDGSWHAHSRHGETPSLRPLRLTPAQWPALRRMAELHLALTTLSRTDAPSAWALQTARRIDALLGDAKARHGMKDRADRILYALQAARFHPDIHRHPLLRHRLSRLDGHGSTYVEACADLKDKRMQQLVSELDASEATRR